MHVNYLLETDFSAYLDILTNSPSIVDDEAKESKALNNFVSLTFSFHGGVDNVHLSIMKTDSDNLRLKVFQGNAGYIGKLTKHNYMSETALQLNNLEVLNKKCLVYSNPETLLERSKRVLRNMNTIAKGILSAPNREEAACAALTKIITLLDCEIEEHTNCLILNEDNFASHRSSSERTASLPL